MQREEQKASLEFSFQKALSPTSLKASSSSIGRKGKGDPIKSTISLSLFFTATLNPNSRLLPIRHRLPERGKKFRGRKGREGRLQRVRTSLMRDRGRAKEEAFSISRRLSKRGRRGVSTEKREREKREGGREEGRRNAWPSLPSSSRAAKSGRNKEEAGRGEGLSRIQATGARRGERGTEARTPNPKRDQGVVCAEGWGNFSASQRHTVDTQRSPREEQSR